jgi:2-oxoisovalerate dehydrogenase E1 component
VRRAQIELRSGGRRAAGTTPPGRVANSVAETADHATEALAAQREAAHGGKLPERGGPLTLAQTINAALTDVLLSHPQSLLFGEDVARKGGVYGVTKGLRDRVGPARVFDTLLDETSILGLGIGAGLGGLLPLPEIHTWPTCTTPRTNCGRGGQSPLLLRRQIPQPMVVRIAGLAYQQGFGGHFHNDHSVAACATSGMVLAVPARADDAAHMLRTCVAAALVDGTVSVFLEPIALYHTRDPARSGRRRLARALHAAGGLGHRSRARRQGAHVSFGSADRITIITFGNGLRMSLRVAAELGSGAAWSTCAGSRRCPSPTSSGRHRPPAGS